MLCGNIGSILPVAHPANDCAATIRTIAEAYRSIVVLAIVHPFGRHIAVCVLVGGKGLAVEITDEVLSGTTTERTTGVDVADKYPFREVFALNREHKEVGALPHTVLLAKPLTERAFESPLFQVGRAEDEHFMFEGVSKDNVPLADSLVPEHIRVASLALEGAHRASIKYRERFATIGACSKALHLACSSRGVESNDSIFTIAHGVLVVDSAATAEHSAKTVGEDCIRLVLPVDEVGRSRVTPSHILPLRAVGVVLIIKMPHTVFVEHTIWVVHPSV